MSQVIVAMTGSGAGVAVWRLLQYVLGRWFDERKGHSTDLNSILHDRDSRIGVLEKLVIELQAENARLKANEARLEERVRWLEQFCSKRQEGSRESK